MDEESDPLSEALGSRRIPHSRSGKRGRGGGGKSKHNATQSSFNPMRCLGRYEVHLGSTTKRARHIEGGPRSDPSLSYLELHELTPSEDGLIGTFGLADRLNGICVLAGSRKHLARIVSELEEESKGDEEDVDIADDYSNIDGNSGEDQDGEVDDDLLPQQTSIEAEDERINHRIRAFEKNSFRNPKFWMRWKGQALSQGEQAEADVSLSTELNSGYLIFSSNSCEKFEGTITCETFGWDNLKLQGYKTHSRSTACPMTWNGFG